MTFADQTVRDFAALFEGRVDAWGSLEGGCVREAVATGTVARHLKEPGQSLGIYPLIQDDWLAREWERRMGGPCGDNFVKWGCTDIDNNADPESCWPLALNMQGSLAALGITSWVERTKGKGYHVWVFAEEWVPAIVMRRALLVAHQVAGVAPTEVNPKQVDAGQRVELGNYVNLPYPHGWNSIETRGKRAVFMPSGHLIDLESFIDGALEERATFDTLRTAAKLYREPPKRSVDRLTGPSAAAGELAKGLPGLAFTIWRDGPLAGRDRSNTLTRLAHLCAEAEFSASDALELVRDADRRWGKFSDRADGESHLVAIIEAAYR